MPSDESVKIGDRIRDARKARRLTLQRVADATGLSIGFLSQVERDITTPSLSSLVTIARALDVSINAFLQAVEIPNGVTRHEDRAVYSLHPSWIVYERLSSEAQGQSLSAVKMRIPPHYLSETSTHEGEEVVYILSGTLRYVIEGAVYELNAGDSLHFSPQRPHKVHNPTDQPVDAILVGTQPLFVDFATPLSDGGLAAATAQPVGRSEAQSKVLG